MEYLDIVDEKGMPTGEIIDREKAHAEGIMHRTSHVWIVRKRDGKIEILLQKRCDTKESFPGCYDISSAGHIPAGVDFKPSAIRELEEELGLIVAEEELIDCGNRIVLWNAEFFGKPFHDKQFSKVFALWCDKDESEFRLQEEEVSEVRWMVLEDVIKAVETNSIPNCISVDELLIVKNGID